MYTNLGFGLGLRAQHYQTILERLPPAIDWFEILTENYLIDGGKPLYYLDKIRAHYPMVMHGVSMSLGSTDPLDKAYLQRVKTLMQRIDPAWISDHLCWTGVQRLNTHDLLPLPFNEATLQHVVARIQTVQEYLGRQLLLENVSSYVTFRESTMSEAEFLQRVAEAADCFILLDINNIYVNAINHGTAPEAFLQPIAPHRVMQFHLAGHSHRGDHIVDTHDAPISQPVWDLYATALQRFPETATLIERDQNIPPLDDLISELNHARNIAT